MDPYEFLVRVNPNGTLSGCHRRDYLPSGAIGQAVPLTIEETITALEVYRPLVLDPESDTMLGGDQ